jgi:hypothetical protein
LNFLSVKSDLSSLLSALKKPFTRKKRKAVALSVADKEKSLRKHSKRNGRLTQWRRSRTILILSGAARVFRLSTSKSSKKSRRLLLFLKKMKSVRWLSLNSASS